MNAPIREDVDDPDRVVVYRTGKGTRDSWLRGQLPKPYRQRYEQGWSELLKSRSVDWLVPAAEWGSRLTT